MSLTRIVVSFAIGALIVGGVSSSANADDCTGFARVVKSEGSVTEARLICAGECSQGATCEPRKVGHTLGATSEVCACGEEAGESCQPYVLDTGIGGPQVGCGGQCEEPLACVCVEEVQGNIRNKEGPIVAYVRCGCR